MTVDPQELLKDELAEVRAFSRPESMSDLALSIRNSYALGRAMGMLDMLQAQDLIDADEREEWRQRFEAPIFRPWEDEAP